MKLNHSSAFATICLVMACLSCELAVANITGRVVDNDSGRALANIGVTLSNAAEGADSITVFTDKSGSFRVNDITSETEIDKQISITNFDYKVVDIDSPSIKNKEFDIEIKVTKKQNIADSVPASKWMADSPDTPEKHLTNFECSQCHQFPTQKILNYGRLIEEARAKTGDDSVAAEKWAEQVRKEGWRAAIKYMRAKAYEIYPEGSEVDIANIPWEIIQGEAFTLFNKEQTEKITNYLASYFPRETSYFDPQGYQHGAKYGDLTKVVIKEYQLPNESLVREAITLRNSKYIWGADIEKNQLIRVDPETGKLKKYPVPYDGATGPHTLVGDKDGNLWVSMMDNDLLGVFYPSTEKWKLWTLTPSNHTAQKILGGQASVHDIAYNNNGELALDKEGRLWTTLVGINHMASLEPKTGRVEFYPGPPVEGFTPLAISLYGTLLSSDGECAWFTQLNGYFGCFNTQTNKPESLEHFGEGAAPRRMARDENDTVWIPLYGAGKIVKYDGRKRKVLAKYDLPDRRAAPYALAWDNKRNALWVTTTNADVIYRFDPESESFSVYPLPRKQAYLRQLGIDHKTGNLIGSYGNIPATAGPSMALVIEIND